MFKNTFIALLGAFAIFIHPSSHAQMDSAHAKLMSNSGFSVKSDLRADMRSLWDEHVAYTRNFITSYLAGLDDTGAVTQRLLKNQDDIGNAIKPIYGEAAGSKLAALLRDHIVIAAELTGAAKAGNGDAVAAGKAKGLANAAEIAQFLSGANPNWARPQIEDMLYKHLDYVIAQVTARLSKDWAADIRANDEGRRHMLMFADVIAAGLVKQFPEKFPR